MRERSGGGAIIGVIGKRLIGISAQARERLIALGLERCNLFLRLFELGTYGVELGIGDDAFLREWPLTLDFAVR